MLVRKRGPARVPRVCDLERGCRCKARLGIGVSGKEQPSNLETPSSAITGGQGTEGEAKSADRLGCESGLSLLPTSCVMLAK